VEYENQCLNDKCGRYMAIYFVFSDQLLPLPVFFCDDEIWMVVETESDNRHPIISCVEIFDIL